MTDNLHHDQPDFIALRGHREACAIFQNALNQGRLHHGWIFAGTKGIGKFRLAMQIAAWLFSQPSDQDNLFADNHIASPDILDNQIFTSEEGRLVSSGAHPDLLIIKAEENDKNKSGQIKIEQVRKITHFFNHSASRGGWRIAIIDSLEEMNHNGMNAILKTLEEPPERSLIILLSSRTGQVLPTIKSRVVKLNLSALSADDCYAVIKNIWPESDDEYCHQLGHLSQGAPGQAVSLSESGALPLFEQFCALIGKADVNLSDLSLLAEKWAGGGIKNTPKRHAASYFFDELLSVASLQASARDSSIGISSFQHIEYCQQAIDRLSRQHEANKLALWHQEFLYALAQGERLYLDLVPVMTRFFFNLHSQSKSG